MSDGSGSNRRAFFGRAWRDALAAAPKVAPKPFAVAAALSDKPKAVEPPPVERDVVVTPSAATGSVTFDELLAHAETLGLADRARAIAKLVSPSVRLTPHDDGRSTVGGDQCLAQIDLASLAGLGVTPPLPADGWLRCTDDGVTVLSAPAPVTGAQSVAPSLELSLPRVWAAPVVALDLDDEERATWQELRIWLADRQHVELHDRTPDFLGLHRLLGYPDETSGDMPLHCELLASGAELGDEPPRLHPLAREVEKRVGRWRLLLQLSTGGRERAYFWIAREDLDAGDFAGVHVIR